ncbi:MAG: HAMP domain-containing protein [Ruminococcaceae bacterium]|nr:HAMP domain-containing protein [Oscillospiraceae bacterium]
MPKGIFSKILWSILLVILLFSLITGTSLTFMMQKYVFASEEKAMLQNAFKIRDLTLFLLEHGSEEGYALFQRSLNSNSEQLNSAIFVTDVFGQVMLAAQENQSPRVGSQMTVKEMDLVLEGEMVRQWSDLGGTFPEKRLNIILPLILDGKVGGALFLSSPMPQIDFLMMNVIRILLLSVLLSLLVSFVVAYFVSRWISNPIRNMKKAAEEFAKGKFDSRISDQQEGEMGELATAFNHMAQSLDELEQNRRSFVANVSHELRSPLTTIGGFAEGLLDGTIPEESREQYLSILLDEVKRMTRLVNDLLYMERSDKEELHQSVFDLNELIRLVLIGMEARITQKQIEVSVTFCNEVEYVNADRDGILRVVTNLLDNAVKFTPEQGKIFIALKEEASFVQIRIGNTGDVIEQDVLKHIFDRFYKGDQSRGINKDGTGLGLHIVKSILSKHGQSIQVTSTEEQGTNFRFSLPKQK